MEVEVEMVEAAVGLGVGGGSLEASAKRKGPSGEERGGSKLNGPQIHIERSHICILSAGPR